MYAPAVILYCCLYVCSVFFIQWQFTADVFFFIGGRRMMKGNDAKQMISECW